MASHAFITTWLLAPGGLGGAVDWGAGRKLGAIKGVFEGGGISHNVQVTGCSDHSISWECSFDEPTELGVHSGYSGPDIFVFFKNAAGNEIGGFLDHWNGPATGRRRSFNNIKEFWKCRNGRPMDPKAIYKTASFVQIGIQGNLGSILSDWKSIR